MTNRTVARDLKEYDARHLPVSSFHALDQYSFASDILEGVRELAVFLKGSADNSAIRSIYHRTETSNTIPTFKLGSMTCARKSVIRATIWMQEKRAWTGEEQELLVRVNILLTSILAMIEHNKPANDNHDRAHLSAVITETTKTIYRLLHVGEK